MLQDKIAAVEIQMKAKLAEARATFTHPGNRLPLEDVAAQVASLLAAPVDVEALVQLWPEWTVERPSLFEAYLRGT